MATPEEVLAELERRLTASEDPSTAPVERIDALAALAWELRTIDVPRSHDLANRARELAIGEGYKLGQARAARTMAMTFPDAQGLVSVFDLAEEARRLFDEAGEPAGMAASRDFLSSIHEFSGDLAGGLELALDALGIARSIGDAVRQGYALSSVGGILAAAGQVDAAVEHLEEALSLFEGVGDGAGINTICQRLSKVLRAGGRPDEAVFYAEKVRATDDRIDGYSHWAATEVMAGVAADRGEPGRAEALYREALRALSEPARTIVGAETQVELARLLIAERKLDAAEEELRAVLDSVAGRSMMAVVETASHEGLADIAEQRGDLVATVRHLRAAQALRDGLAERDARNKLTQVEVRAAMEAAKKDAAHHKMRFEELHAMQAKLVEAEKMGLLGKLAAGTAHELNTPLGVLRSNTELSAGAAKQFVDLLADVPGDASARAGKLLSVLQSCAEASGAAMERIGAITESFGRFTQLDQAERRNYDVHEGLDSTLALLEPTTGGSVCWERDFGPTPAVDAWPRELNHAFLTVLQNAAQALDGGGTVTVSTREDDGMAVVEVRDSGRGMDAEEVASLFDVAWGEDGTRTKMRLGLSAAYSTLQKLGGTIEVESTPGKGTSFTFRIPSAAARK